MKSAILSVLAIFLLVLIGFAVYRFAIPAAPNTDEERRILGWIVSGSAFVVTDSGVERVFVARWDSGHGDYILYNRDGIPLGRIAKNELLQAIELRANPRVSLVAEMPSIDVPPSLPLPG